MMMIRDSYYWWVVFIVDDLEWGFIGFYQLVIGLFDSWFVSIATVILIVKSVVYLNLYFIVLDWLLLTSWIAVIIWFGLSNRGCLYIHIIIIIIITMVKSILYHFSICSFVCVYANVKFNVTISYLLYSSIYLTSCYVRSLDWLIFLHYFYLSAGSLYYKNTPH